MTQIKPWDYCVNHKNCPIGLFTTMDGELCIKTEYGDSYIVSTGEKFCNYTKTKEELANVMVVPCDVEDQSNEKKISKRKSKLPETTCDIPMPPVKPPKSPKERKKYLISFHSWDGYSDGFGSATVTINKNEDIYTTEGIKALTKRIKSDERLSGVAILNIIPLND